jgi:hypothetical protein
MVPLFDRAPCYLREGPLALRRRRQPLRRNVLLAFSVCFVLRQT